MNMAFSGYRGETRFFQGVDLLDGVPLSKVVLGLSSLVYACPLPYHGWIEKICHDKAGSSSQFAAITLLSLYQGQT